MGKQAQAKPLCGLIGHPVSHSASPRLFAELSKLTKMPLEYRLVDVAPKDLELFIKTLEHIHLFHGLNVTIPHKCAVINWAKNASPEAKAIGAANVLHFKAGQIEAHNTDILGFERTIKESDIKLKSKTALVYGAGGAARTAVFSLARLGASQIILINRTKAKAKAIIKALAPRYLRTHFEAHQICPPKTAATIIVNATCLGMQGFPRFDLMLPQKESLAGLAFDLVYVPKNTSFLKKATNSGFSPMGGLNMLVWQALCAYEIWFGQVKNSAILHRKLMLLL